MPSRKGVVFPGDLHEVGEERQRPLGGNLFLPSLCALSPTEASRKSWSDKILQ